MTTRAAFRDSMSADPRTNANLQLSSFAPYYTVGVRPTSATASARKEESPGRRRQARTLSLSHARRFQAAARSCAAHGLAVRHGQSLLLFQPRLAGVHRAPAATGAGRRMARGRTPGGP